MGFDRRIISSFNTVPPVVTMAPTFMCFAISITIADVCKASSRVGTRIRAVEGGISWGGGGIGNKNGLGKNVSGRGMVRPMVEVTRRESPRIAAQRNYLVPNES